MRTLYDGTGFEAIREGPVFRNGTFTTKYDTGIQYQESGRADDIRYRWISESEGTGGVRTRNIDEAEYTAITTRYTGTSVTLYGRGEAAAVSRSASVGTRGGASYLGKDILGSVRSATDDYGALEDRYEYDAFGKPYKGDMTQGMNLGYTGKPYDAATGLYNYGYRDYAPETARFTTVDPVRDGANWFAYVNNDPVNYIDPWGLFSLNGVWVAITEWHYEGRDEKNKTTETPEEIAESARNNLGGWTKEDRDIFHQGKNDDIHDTKYTNRDGREVVIDGATGKIDTNPETRGTYNYVDPGVAPEKWNDIAGWAEYGTRAVGHFFADVVPYAILGNDRPSNTNKGCGK
jgi:RHS repeat-associated protein